MKNTDIAETCAIIATELNKKQPVLLSGRQHAFICDGYRDGYFHLNLGWRGAANGYYKLLLDEDLKDKETTEGIIKEIVFDISPDNGDKNLQRLSLLIVQEHCVTSYLPYPLSIQNIRESMERKKGITIRDFLKGITLIHVRALFTMAKFSKILSIR